MTTDTNAAVAFRDVERRLGKSAGANVTFRVAEFHAAPGDQVALTGPSGCGKSTLLNLTAGLLRPDRGSVCVRGQDLGRLGNAALDDFRGRNIGFIYQTFNLLDAFTALENVQLGLRFGRALSRNEHQRRASELLHRVNLSSRLHARPSRMSVGERQRVAIARALANHPAIILADEPTGSLDPATGASIFALLREVCAEEQCTLLFVTHDHDLANQLPRQFDCRGLVTTGGTA